MSRVRTACFSILLFIAAPLYAEWELAAAIGYGQRSNPLINSDDIDTLVNIDIAWYGERWFFDNGDLGFTLLNNDKLSLNLLGQLNNERVFFGKTNTQLVNIGTSNYLVSAHSDNPPVGNGAPINNPIIGQPEPPDKNYAYEAGLELIYDSPHGHVQLQALSDISNQHQGQRVNVTYSHPYLWQRWLIQPSVGLTWKSQALLDYYFGVSQSEANTFFLQYRTRAGLSHFVQLRLNYALSKQLFLGAVIEYETLSQTVANSPLIIDDRVITGFTGIKYVF